MKVLLIYGMLGLVNSKPRRKGTRTEFIVLLLVRMAPRSQAEVGTIPSNYGMLLDNPKLPKLRSVPMEVALKASPLVLMETNLQVTARMVRYDCGKLYHRLTEMVLSI